MLIICVSSTMYACEFLSDDIHELENGCLSPLDLSSLEFRAHNLNRSSQFKAQRLSQIVSGTLSYLADLRLDMAIRYMNCVGHK